MSLALSGCGGSSENVESSAPAERVSEEETETAKDDAPADLVVSQVQKMNMFLDSELDGDTAIFTSDAHDHPERLSNICQRITDELAEFGHPELKVKLEIDAHGHIDCAEEHVRDSALVGFTDNALRR